MNDFLDKIIAKCRAALHEGQRQRAVARRREKDARSEATNKLDQIQDRIAFHVPIREQLPQESKKDYAKYVAEVKLFRHCLMLRTVAAMQPADDMWDGDAPDAFTRGDL